MNEIWEQISGYIMPIITVILSSGLGAVLVRAMSSSWFRKHDLNTMATHFADKLTGSKINIDLKAVTEKQLDKIDKAFQKKLLDLEEKSNLILASVCDIINSIKSSAKLSKAESENLISRLEAAKQAVKPLEYKEEITIELHSTETVEQPAQTKNQESSLINIE